MLGEDGGLALVPSGVLTRAGLTIRLLVAQHEVTLRHLEALHRDLQRLVCVRASS